MDSDFINQYLSDIIELARLAPSVHNTQPWLVVPARESILIKIDAEHALSDGDPTGRQTIISLGIFAEAICVAAERYGVMATSVNMKNREATINFKSGERNQQGAEFLRKRCTDRSIYRSAHLTQQMIKSIESSEHPEGVEVKVITNRAIMRQIAQLTGRGIRLALSNPAFRRELSRYLVLPWSRNTRGISVKSLYIAWPLAIMEPWLVRWGIGLQAEAIIEKRRWLSASAVVAILGDGDLEASWFKAGRAYLRASLAIESLGLSQATSAAIVEASNYHEDIEGAMHTNQRLLALIRIGKGRKKRYYSPRVAAADLITLNSRRD